MHSTRFFRLIPLAFAVALVAGCKGGSAPETAAVNSIPVETVSTTLLAGAFEAGGSVVSEERVRVASRLSAAVKKVFKREGDGVKKGDILMELDSTEVTAALAAAREKCRAAEAAWIDAKTDDEKYQSLFKEGLVSDNARRKYALKAAGAKGDLAQAKALVESLENQVAYLTIRSEIDGHVSALLKHEGELSIPGVPLMVVDPDDKLMFEFTVPQEQYELVKNAGVCRVTVDGKTYRAPIVRLTVSADRLSRSHLARAVLPANAPVRPGMYGRAAVEFETDTRVAVPETALTERAGLTGVFVVREGKALFQWVRTGQVRDGRVAVRSGLSGGETLVSRPSAQLFDGAPVSVQSAGAQ